MKNTDNNKIYNGIIDWVLIQLNSCGADFHVKMKADIPEIQKIIYTKFISEPDPNGFDFTPGIFDYINDLIILNDSAVRVALVELDFNMNRSLYNHWIEAKTYDK